MVAIHIDHASDENEAVNFVDSWLSLYEGKIKQMKQLGF